MDDLSTTRAACDPVAGCECSCERGWQDVQDEVNRALDSADPLERNRRITKAYNDLAKADSRNLWVKLASYVSIQGGCAMQRVQSWYSVYPPGRWVINKPAALEALAAANSTIFSSIYPVMRFAQKCGAAQLRKCVESGAFTVDSQLLVAMDNIESGELGAAADIIARYEQVKIVQPVYEKYAGGFNGLMRGEAMLPGDQTSIPISKECTHDSDMLVDIGDLDITNPEDRVQYYGRLMRRMLQQDSSARGGRNGGGGASGSW
ncbi:hypothetical protein [Paracoccus sp. S1E-3]|uniref:DUF2515 family protein n=1 Tax=Paracoccus sp. S1E-3 TaxID=2756130 RepID=UPI0015EF7A73|nr:hypothetical protein [Paracoccus sp. S1E-3]MBA4490445.1 hypothetical protein [Paracoccus sp. S1E-3]